MMKKKVGWTNQTKRHSNAKKYGHAGGKYATPKKRFKTSILDKTNIFRKPPTIETYRLGVEIARRKAVRSGLSIKTIDKNGLPTWVTPNSDYLLIKKNKSKFDVVMQFGEEDLGATLMDKGVSKEKAIKRVREIAKREENFY